MESDLLHCPPAMAAPAPAPASAPSSASTADPADDAAEAPRVRVEKSAISSGTYHSNMETGCLYDGTQWRGARHKTKLLWSGSIKWTNGTVYTGEFLVHDEHKMTRERALKCGDGYRPFYLSRDDTSHPLIFSQHYDISAIPEADPECAESQGRVYDRGGGINGPSRCRGCAPTVDGVTVATLCGRIGGGYCCDSGRRSCSA